MSKKNSRRKSRKRKNKILITLIIMLSIVVVMMIIYQLFFTNKVQTVVQIEAGTKVLDVSSFLKNKNETASFDTDVSKLDLNKIGSYPVKIKIGNSIYESNIEIVDTTPPIVETKNYDSFVGETVTPEQFLLNVQDETKVTSAFKQDPDTSKEGEQQIILICTDEGGNQTEAKASLTVGHVRSNIEVEVGAVELEVDHFIMDPSKDSRVECDLSSVDLNKIGTYPVQLTVDDKKYDATVTVVDTVAPEASLSGANAYLNANVAANIFVKNIKDFTNVTVEYKSKPDFSKLGQVSFQVVLRDEGKNETIMPVTAKVIKDTKAPVIKGVKDQTIYIGGKVSYKKDITVIDNSGETISLSVDNSKVNPKKEGMYDVTYSAKDSSGNETKVKAVFTVAKQPNNYVEPEEVDRVADKLLDEILTDGMTKREKAKAIYDWIRGNVRYENHSDKTDWVQAAYRAMTKRTGDCFNYYAIAQELLTRAGIDNMKVQKLDGYKSKHYWNLVNLGDGWYHYDTTPRRAGGYFFLWTDAKLKAYSDKHGNSHIFDHSKYPATPLK